MLSRQTWTIACWTVLALLAAAAVWRQDPSIAIAVGVAAVWGLFTGFTGPARVRR
jgi:hypothetical protein